ncbi:hypothetical protein NPIL_349301 [Nephila pilipes]|uniref:Uncharacterized protein n=1 Tax=Nephila pilipes TaxID=299642 RepID=A0A8X6ULC2_NEPPI|nr:hypothetical protein NPIL_349301 [Nephila pilipes]
MSMWKSPSFDAEPPQSTITNSSEPQNGSETVHHRVRILEAHISDPLGLNAGTNEDRQSRKRKAPERQDRKRRLILPDSDTEPER